VIEWAEIIEWTPQRIDHSTEEMMTNRHLRSASCGYDSITSTYTRHLPERHRENRVFTKPNYFERSLLTVSAEQIANITN
jgi:hypothetical protein